MVFRQTSKSITYAMKNAGWNSWFWSDKFLKQNWVFFCYMYFYPYFPNASFLNINSNLWKRNTYLLNTQNMTNPTILSPVKIEYVWNFSISGLKMMVKSGLEKIFLKFLHALTMSFLLLNFDQEYKFSNKNNMLSTWRNFKIFFLDHFSP